LDVTDEIPGRWEMYHHARLRKFYFPHVLLVDQMRDSWIGGTCSTHGKDEEYIQVLSRKSEGEETRWKTWLCIGD